VNRGKPILKVLIVDESPERAEIVQEGLKDLGCEIVGRVAGRVGLAEVVAASNPDVIVIDVESPDRDILEDMRTLNRLQPRPVVMFAHDGDTEKIRAAIDAGVSAYIVDGLSSSRVRPIVEVAMARFRQYQALREELDQAKSSLEERKVVERAKGILMRKKGLGEAEAYESLRKMAMSSNQRLIEVARKVIDVAELIG
jgi:two-component system, response regulator / RNA-binding antiterminator